MIEHHVTLHLDHRKIRSIEHLMRWAEEAFSLPMDVRDGVDIDVFTDRLYHHIGKGTIGYTVVEHHAASRSRAVGAVMASPGKGWKTALVSGIAHDYGLHLTFSQAPRPPRARRWWWPW